MNAPGINRAIDLAGGQTALAKLMGVTQGLIHQLTTGRSNLTPERAVQIETVLGGKVTCEELLPQFEWQRDQDGKVASYTVRVENVHLRAVAA